MDSPRESIDQKSVSARTLYVYIKVSSICRENRAVTEMCKAQVRSSRRYMTCLLKTEKSLWLLLK